MRIGRWHWWGAIVAAFLLASPASPQTVVIAPAAEPTIGQLVTIYVPGRRQTITAPLGVQMGPIAKPRDGLVTLAFIPYEGGILAPIFNDDWFMPIIELGAVDIQGFRYYKPGNLYEEGYAWFGQFVSGSMLIFAMDGNYIEANGEPWYNTWAAYFANRPTIFPGNQPSRYMLIEYHLIEKDFGDGRLQLVSNANGAVRTFTKIIRLAEPDANNRRKRARLRDEQDANGVDVVALMGKLIVGIAVAGVISGSSESLVDSIARQTRECESYRARIGAAIAC